jgi:GntR family transcriptional regulator
MEWNIKGDRPIYAQLVDQIKHFIVSGRLTPGSKLPSVRDMAQDASVNPNTMQKALSLLDEEGLVLPQSTMGRFITRDLALIERVRSTIATERMQALIRELLSLGYSPDEILSICNERIAHITAASERSSL